MLSLIPVEEACLNKPQQGLEEGAEESKIVFRNLVDYLEHRIYHNLDKLQEGEGLVCNQQA